MIKLIYRKNRKYPIPINVSLSKSHSAPMTELTLGWRLSKGWSVSVSVRDNINSYSSWTLDGDYSAYTRSDYKDRRWTPMIGLSYYFNNKVQPKYRNKKMLYNNESDSFVLKSLYLVYNHEKRRCSRCALTKIIFLL